MNSLLTLILVVAAAGAVSIGAWQLTLVLRRRRNTRESLVRVQTLSETARAWEPESLTRLFSEGVSPTSMDSYATSPVLARLIDEAISMTESQFPAGRETEAQRQERLAARRVEAERQRLDETSRRTRAKQEDLRKKRRPTRPRPPADPESGTPTG